MRARLWAKTGRSGHVQHRAYDPWRTSRREGGILLIKFARRDPAIVNELPLTRYAVSGKVNVAYQMMGEDVRA